ncbi:MAG: glutamine-hydrolyzing GMP synthase, partial [Calditrichaeota bacterium]
MSHAETIVVLDFGSQYTQLIARRVRECGVYSEIKPFHISTDELRAMNPAGIILSGGPSSVYAENAPLPDPAIFDLGCPILGICYGLQIIAHLFDGEVDKAPRREFGRAQLYIDDAGDLFHGLDSPIEVWMSHGDHLTRLPRNFHSIAHSPNSPIAALKHAHSSIFGIQFHPEVVHTPFGKEILANFIFRVCSCRGDWDSESFIDATVSRIRDQVG